MLPRSDAKLEPYLLLAKGARGQGLVELVGRVTAEPGVFTFGELLDMPGLQELRASQPQAFELLSIFAYGSWVDYQSKQPALPPLSEAQEVKLKQLTVVAMAAETRTIPYARLESALQLPSLRAVEDFLIGRCLYPDLLRGRLDQRRQCLVVHEAVPRDVPPGDLPALLQGLHGWLQRTQEVQAALGREAAAIGERVEREAEAARAHREACEQAAKDQQQRPPAGGPLGDSEMLQLQLPPLGGPSEGDARPVKESRTKRRR